MNYFRKRITDLTWLCDSTSVQTFVSRIFVFSCCPYKSCTSKLWDKRGRISLFVGLVKDILNTQMYTFAAVSWYHIDVWPSLVKRRDVSPPASLMGEDTLIGLPAHFFGQDWVTHSCLIGGHQGLGDLS